MVERHHGRFRCWLIDGENREGWIPLMTDFLDTDAVAFVMSDNGRTYMNISEEYDVNHETVEHNRRFVNPDRIPHWFEKHNMEVQVKVHTNTIEGAWGHLKPKLRVKRGIKTKNDKNGQFMFSRENSLGNWCHFYSF